MQLHPNQLPVTSQPELEGATPPAVAPPTPPTGTGPNGHAADDYPLSQRVLAALRIAQGGPAAQAGESIATSSRIP